MFASSMWSSLLIHGVKLGFSCIPLHRVFLKSTLPVERVSLLLGNDVTGTKVTGNPCLCNLPCPGSTIEASQEIYGCTHAMAKQAEKQSLLLADDLAKSHTVDLSDTFLADNNDLHDSISCTVQRV